MRTKILNAVRISGLAIALSLGMSYVYAWTAPTVAPTGGNAAAPINVSSTPQVKNGSLTLYNSPTYGWGLDVLGGIIGQAQVNGVGVSGSAGNGGTGVSGYGAGAGAHGVDATGIAFGVFANGNTGVYGSGNAGPGGDFSGFPAVRAVASAGGTGVVASGATGVSSTGTTMGVNASASGSSSTGVYGDSPSGKGVYGHGNYGVMGSTNNSSGGGIGVWGFTDGGSGTGVQGQVSSGTGVIGFGGSGTGVYGSGAAIGVDGYSTGSVAIRGNGVIGVWGTGSTYDFQGGGGEHAQAGSWTNSSDRSKKENFVPVDNQLTLAKIIALPMTQWNYKSDKKGLHIGPIAQDFYAIFGLGSDDISISTIDPAGVALVGVKALNEKIDAQQKEIDELKAEIQALRK